jgi:hypothetical protein
MIPLLKQFFHDLFYSPEKVTLWARSLTGFLFGLLATVMASVAGPDGLPDLDKLKGWGWKGWLARCAVAAVLSVALGFKAGEKNAAGELPKS